MVKLTLASSGRERKPFLQFSFYIPYLFDQPTGNNVSNSILDINYQKVLIIVSVLLTFAETQYFCVEINIKVRLICFRIITD